MIKKIFLLLSTIFIYSCGGVELVLSDDESINDLKNNVFLEYSGDKEVRLDQELVSVFGNNKNGEYILVTSFLEKKENRVVKKNQVAEKIDYELFVNYELYFKNKSCKIYKKQISSRFSFVPKSFGYNFGADKSLEKLYLSSIRKNIRVFKNEIPFHTNCI